MKIQATIKYIDLEMGFWGLITADGSEYRPVEFPEQLKSEGKKTSCTIEVLEDHMSFIMWGTPVKIISFSTLD